MTSTDGKYIILIYKADYKMHPKCKVSAVSQVTGSNEKCIYELIQS